MSKAAVEQVIERLATDNDFRAALAAEPEAALAEYELTAEERASLVHLEVEEAEEKARSLDDRKSKGTSLSNYTLQAPPTSLPKIG